MINPKDLTILKTVDGGLQSLSIVCLTVALGTRGLEADELTSIDGFVKGLAALEETAILTEKTLGLSGAVLDITLNTTLSTTRSKSIALGPVLDSRATSEEFFTLEILDSCLGTGEVNVVDDQCTTTNGNAGFGERSVHANGSVEVLAVHQKHRTDGLIVWGVGHVKTDLAVIEGVRLHSPEPVPVHINTSSTLVEGHVAGGELLATKESADSTAVEDQISHEATRSVVLEDTLLVLTILSVRRSHVKDDVLDARGLRDLPMHTGCGFGISDIDDKVTDRAVEIVLVGEPVGAISAHDVRIGIDEAHALERSSSLENGELPSIADELGVVVLEEWFADHVGARREVDNGGGDGSGVTAFTTPYVAIARLFVQ